MLAGDPRIPQQTAPTVRARKTAKTYKGHDCTMWPVKGFYSPKSEQRHVPPCVLCRVQRCHKRHAMSSSGQLLRAHPEHLRLWNAAKPGSVRSGAERNEAEDLPCLGKLYNIL